MKAEALISLPFCLQRLRLGALVTSTRTQKGREKLSKNFRKVDVVATLWLLGRTVKRTEPVWQRG